MAYRSILYLVSSDHDRDEAALRKLIQSFPDARTSIYLLHVAAQRVTGFGAGTARGHITSDMQARQEVYPQLKRLCEQHAIPLAHIHTEVGDPLPMLERFVREYGIELLVFAVADQTANAKLLPLLDTCPCDLHIMRYH